MKRNLISLSRNTDLNLKFLLSSKEQEEKNSLFKTVQNENQIIPKKINQYYLELKKKETNLFKKSDKCIKTNYNTNFTNILISDDIESKIVSPISNTIRYNYSKQGFKYNNYGLKKYKSNTSYSGSELVKLNKPYLLGILNKDLISKDSKTSNNKSLHLKQREKIINNYIIKRNKTFGNNNKKIKINIKSKKHFFSKPKNEYKIKEKNKHQKHNKIIIKATNFFNTFKKIPKLRIKFPLEFPNFLYFDKEEINDTVDFDYYGNDENLKKRIRKSILHEINMLDEDNGIYSEYYNSIPNYINYIYDINVIPHIKNKFCYNKSLREGEPIDKIKFNRNAITKEVAKSLNKYIINNIRKEILEKEKKLKIEKILKEMPYLNKFIAKLYLAKDEENLPKLTIQERIDINDYFNKNIDYKFVNFAKGKLKDIVYNDYFFKENDN